MVVYYIHAEGQGSLDHVVEHLGYMLSTLQMANALTMVNTTLLLTTGVLAGYAVHALSMRLPVLACTLMHTIVSLGMLFLSVQCMEYGHLYWCIHSS